MAVANSLAAIENGATRIEGTINGIGERAGNAALEEVAAVLHVRQDYYQVRDHIQLSQTWATSQLVSEAAHMAIPNNKAVVGANAFAHESGIHQDGMLKNPQTYEILTPQTVGAPAMSLPLGKLSGSHAVMHQLQQLGYQVDSDKMRLIFPHFKTLAAKTDMVRDSDLMTMMTELNMGVA